eukprot:178526-Rhodomonas_salina.1
MALPFPRLRSERFFAMHNIASSNTSPDLANSSSVAVPSLMIAEARGEACRDRAQAGPASFPRQPIPVQQATELCGQQMLKVERLFVWGSSALSPADSRPLFEIFQHVSDPNPGQTSGVSGKYSTPSFSLAAPSHPNSAPSESSSLMGRRKDPLPLQGNAAAARGLGVRKSDASGGKEGEVRWSEGPGMSDGERQKMARMEGKVNRLAAR